MSTIFRKLSLTLLFAAALTVSFAPRAAGQQADTLRLTLSEAVSIGLEQSPIVLGKDVEAVNRMYAEREAQSSLYPQVSLGGNYGYTLKKQRIYFDGMPGMGSMPGMEDGIEVGRTHNMQLGVQAGMPLVNLALWKSLSINKQQVDLALQQAQYSRQELIGQIKRAFMSALLARESYETLLKSLKNAELNLRSVQQKYEAGLVAEYDKMRAEVQYANLKPNVLQAEQGVSLSLMQLAVLIGIPPETQIQAVGELKEFQNVSMETVTRASAADTAWVAGNPSFMLMGKQQQLLRESVTLSKLSWLPSISVGANYNFNFSSNEFNLSNNRLWVPFATVSVQFQFPLFSGLKNYFGTRRAKSQVVMAELQRNDLKRSLSLSMKHQLNQALKAQEQYHVARRIQETAEKGYQIAQKRYDTGMATLLEVNDSELAWLQARLNEKQALYDYLTAAIEIEQLLGAEVPRQRDGEYAERLDSIRGMTRYF